MCSYDKYELAEKQLKSFTRSKIRTKVLLCLKDADKNVGELEQEIGSRNTTILHAIKDMIEVDLITRSSKGYHLTNLGKMQAHLLDYMINFAASLDENREFWLTHDISGIPLELIQKIGMLVQSDVVTADHVALLKAQEYFMEKVIDSKEVFGVSPIIIPGYAETIIKCVESDAKVELILTDNIIDIVFKEHKNSIQTLVNFENFNLYRIKNDVKVAFTVTEEHLYLGLFRLDGSYDMGNDLFCTGKNSTMWGKELFNYYRDIAELVKY